MIKKLLLTLACVAGTTALQAQDEGLGPLRQTIIDGQPVAYHLSRFCMNKYEPPPPQWRHSIEFINLGSKKVVLDSVISTSDGTTVLSWSNPSDGTLGTGTENRRTWYFTDYIGEPETRFGTATLGGVLSRGRATAAT
jgi:hypothetical protein